MISLGNRDANKGLGLGLGLGGAVGPRAMEETELEEGEACSYHNSNNEFEDPDIALSYIDEKLQHVLGHFQKDFEGGVSAENLGSKFGGYGSFLPTYQRSPVWSQPRTPPIVHNSNASISPNNFPLEAGCRNSAVSSTAPQPLRSGPASSATSLPVMKGSTFNEPVKEETSMPSGHAAEVALSNEILSKKNLPDQKTLKLRIKVGSDNLSKQKNPKIYSVLGLVSPSSSLDDSASESEGMDFDPHDHRSESPATILRDMTCLPVHGGLLLSPLPEYLLNLAEKDRTLIDSKSRASLGSGIETARVDDTKVKRGKKTKSVEKKRSGSKRDPHNRSEDLPTKKRDADTLGCEELVTETLKLPLLSNSYSATADTAKGTGRVSDVSKEMLKTLIGDVDLSPAREETVEACAHEKNWDERKVISGDEVSVHPPKKSYKIDKMNEGVKAETNGYMAKKAALNSDLVASAKQKSNQRVASNELDGTKLPPAKEHQSSGGKKKSRGSQSLGSEAADISKGVSSLAPKPKKSSHADTGKRESEEKLLKDIAKSEDRYREFFGDIEQEESKTNLLEMHPEDRLKDPEMVQKNTSKDRSTGKKVDQCSTSEAYPKLVSGAVARPGSGPVYDPAAAQTTVAPVMIKENWVQCDKCQTWRLLPLGTNPDNLPEKWLCSMLNWLPGMNRCGFSEEETTKALIALYQTPAPDGQKNLFTGSFGDVRHPDQSYLNLGSHSVLHGGKRKPGPKDFSGVTVKEDPSQLSNSMRKNIQATTRSGNLNDVSHSPVVSEPYSRQNCKSSDLAGEKHSYKQKEKRKILGHNSDGGGTKSSKLKSKRDADQESFRATKKIKTEGSHSTGDGGTTDNGGALGKHGYKCTEHSAKDLKTDPKDGPHISGKKSKKAKISMDDDVGARKRKVKDSHDASAGIPLQYSRNYVEEYSDNEYQKEKKARISKSEGKESSASKGSGKSEKKVSRAKNQQLGQDLKRDSVPAQPSVAATSSSSKVSGSHKNITSFHEAKGSPVESVSSSPMRTSNTNKGTSARKSLTGKDEAHENELSAGGSLKRCSYGEEDGRSNKAGKMKKEKLTGVLDVQDKDISHLSGDITNHHIVNGNADYSGPGTQYPRKQSTKDDCYDGERQNDSRSHANGSYPGKSTKESSSRSKDKSRNESQEHTPLEVKPKDNRNKSQDKVGVKPEEANKRYADKKESLRKISTDGRRDIQLKLEGHDGPDANFTPKRNVMEECNGERPLKSSSDKTDQAELVNGRGISSSLPPGGAQNGTPVRCPRPTSGSHKGSGSDTLAADASHADDSSKMTKHISKAENGFQHRLPSSNGHRIRDVDAPSPARKESSSQAATNAVKEAKDLKHLADRLKNSGSNSESTGLYFQAALKFLHGASLLESSGSENARHGEMIQSIQMYSSTAKLCEFCAHEYEKSKDMASAALAYKCMEVAYMRVIYSSHSSASRDRHELQSALQIAPPGESPSSSASDVDNLNHSTAVDKTALSKGVSSPQVPGNHIVSVRTRPNFMRLLNFTQDVNFAMEASRKSKNAFAAANASLGENTHREGIISVKRALDFNFQDVEGLLRLVRLAMEAINR